LIKKKVSMEEIISTFSSHISENYASSEEFRDNLDYLLKEKRSRLGKDSYQDSLEKNIVFLDELVSGVEHFLNRLLSGEAGMKIENLENALKEIEEEGKRRVQNRNEIFEKDERREFKELKELKKKGGDVYIEKLQFHYRYWMTLRIFFFEFLNVVVAIGEKYELPRIDDGEFRQILNHLELTANYYIGNVEVEDGK
jgi:hypothetical protein